MAGRGESLKPQNAENGGVGQTPLLLASRNGDFGLPQNARPLYGILIFSLNLPERTLPNLEMKKEYEVRLPCTLQVIGTRYPRHPVK
jgi:hypothetical protein